MDRKEHLKFCSVCTNKSFNSKVGVTCGLTEQIADFEGNCENYIEDEKEVEVSKQWKESLQSDKKKSINKGRIALFLLGGLYVVIGILEGYIIEYHDIIYGIIDWGIAAIFIALAIWSYTKPYLALILGLALYILINLLFAFIDPSTILKGIIWKVLIISSLIYSIKNSKGEKIINKFDKSDILDS